MALRISALIAALIAVPAAADEFKFGLQLDESATAIPRETVLAATAEARTNCTPATPPSEHCALGLVAAAEMLATAGLFDEAERAARTALTMMEALRGPAHEDTSVVRGMLGAVLLRGGRYDQAEPVLRVAAQTLQAGQGGDPELLADHLMNLGIVLAEQRRYADAEPALRRAIAVRQDKLPDNLLAIATARANLGVLLARMGRNRDALAEQQAALTIRRERLKGSHYDLGTSMLNLAELLARQPDAARLIAEPYLRAGLMTREAVLIPGDPRTTLAQTMLAENLDAQGKRSGALELYMLAYAGARETLSPDAPLRIRAAQNLARFLAANDTALPVARTLIREAATGALTRAARAQDFDERSRADLSQWRGVFAGSVVVAWRLGGTVP
ncbi:tetratricopeptide repeat protein [Sphingomonas sp.]|jgi:tetratricopeptide (TPR) repeat protein|uniref:tetratricopeptide repeat protein n=1 Tax=Sphingomonas sp. TaxID=28214 RepID=UPI002E15E363|nr:tetratricopeptide repeat protein [Sphingomonas sp.]